MSYVIGLTGGIASGKTTVANLFHQHFAIDIVDADVIARQVVEPGTPGLSAIKEHFGSDILDSDGHLNRRALRERVFQSQDDKLWLNQLLHPMIREKMLADLEKTTSSYTLLVVPLLVENHLQSLCERVLVVDIDTDCQRQRVIQRDRVSSEQAQRIIDAQASREQRLAVADDVINNQADITELLQQITLLHQLYLDMATQNARQ
ncbi:MULTISPECIES: dephospho-CoA kinase [unclassified Vibrio]|uniref:Dephospho-CoA kinase n=1 Tax=Vibrio sp. HB236076 TaxID=3232307 RepID=A0AB39HF83_9VIBR|nr:dephospho-CoA kinase [Vibrio sp. HB161653]MDP5253999.1 dephospho-CoA kinase [Vibrio sp. HB161653]